MTLIKSPRSWQFKENDVTDEQLYRQRRAFIKQGIKTGLGVSLAAYYPHLAMAAVSGLAERIAAAAIAR